MPSFVLLNQNTTLPAAVCAFVVVLDSTIDFHLASRLDLGGSGVLVRVVLAFEPWEDT